MLQLAAIFIDLDRRVRGIETYLAMNSMGKQWVTGRFDYGSFRRPSVRQRLDSIRLRTVCQFRYVSNSVL